MDSIRINASLTLAGSATGTSDQPDNTTPFSFRTIANLLSTASGASLVSKAIYYEDRTLAAGGNETFTLDSHTNPLRETGQSMTKVRIYVVYHSSASLSSGITVGNAASPFAGTKNTAATTDTLVASALIAAIVPTANGMAAAAGTGVKVNNDDGANAATYSIAIFGE